MPKPTSLDRDGPHRDRTAPRNVVLTRHPAPHKLFKRFDGEWLVRAVGEDTAFPAPNSSIAEALQVPMITDHDRACSIYAGRTGAARTFRRF